MYKRFLAFLFLLTYIRISLQLFFSEEIIDVKPINAFAYIGSQLVLNCTPTAEYMDKINASDLYFSRWNDIRLPDDSVHVFHEQNMAQLNISITSSKDISHYTCVNGKDLSQTGVTAVSVEYYPRPVENISCVVDNWETMKCTWDLGTYVNLNNIEVGILWTSQSGNFNYTCSSYTKTSCSLDKESYNEANEYYLYISIKHREIQVESPSHTVIPSLVVKPSAVIELEGTVENATCIQMQWNHTEAPRNMIYKIQYKSKWDEETKVSITNSTRYLLCDLHPHTIYDISVIAKPELEGFWSDVEDIRIKTIEDVPRTGPKSVNGSFYTENCNGNMRQVYIFFKHVPEFDENGVITKYKAIVNKISGGREEEETFPEQHKIRIFVECDADYIVELIAVNKAGSSSNNSKVYIPKESDGDVDINLHISVSNDTTPKVIAKWMPSTSSFKPQSYVLQWCNNSSPRVCQDDINWITVHGNERNETLPVAAANVLAKNYLFAISGVDENGVASKMSFSQCLYVTNAVPNRPPEGFRINEKNPELTIGVSWLSNPCDTQTMVAIQNYILHYCIADQDGRCDGPSQREKVESSISNYQITQLSAGVNYSLWMQAESNGILGPETERLFAIPRGTVHLEGLIAGIVIAVVISVIVFSVLLFRRRNNIKAYCKKYEVDNPLNAFNKYSMPRTLDYIENGKSDGDGKNLSDLISEDKTDDNIVQAQTDLLNVLNEHKCADKNHSASDGSKSNTTSSESSDTVQYNKFTVVSSDESNKSKTSRESQPETDHSPPKNIVNKNGYVAMNEANKDNLTTEFVRNDTTVKNTGYIQIPASMLHNQNAQNNVNCITLEPKQLLNNNEFKKSYTESSPKEVEVINTKSNDDINEEKVVQMT